MFFLLTASAWALRGDLNHDGIVTLEDFAIVAAQWLVEDPNMALGPELVTNGDFSNGETGWQMAGDTFISESGWCEFYSNGDYLRQNPGISLNKTYQVRVDIGGDVGSGTFKLYCYIENDSYIIQSGGSQEFNLTPTEVSPTAKLEFVFDTTGFTGELIELDNISVREKLGGLSAPAKTFFGENEQ